MRNTTKRAVSAVTLAACGLTLAGCSGEGYYEDSAYMEEPTADAPQPDGALQSTLELASHDQAGAEEAMAIEIGTAQQAQQLRGECGSSIDAIQEFLNVTVIPDFFPPFDSIPGAALSAATSSQCLLAGRAPIFKGCTGHDACYTTLPDPARFPFESSTAHKKICDDAFQRDMDKVCDDQYNSLFLGCRQLCKVQTGSMTEAVRRLGRNSYNTGQAEARARLSPAQLEARAETAALARAAAIPQPETRTECLERCGNINVTTGIGGPGFRGDASGIGDSRRACRADCPIADLDKFRCDRFFVHGPADGGVTCRRSRARAKFGNADGQGSILLTVSGLEPGTHFAATGSGYDGAGVRLCGVDVVGRFGTRDFAHNDFGGATVSRIDVFGDCARAENTSVHLFVDEGA